MMCTALVGVQPDVLVVQRLLEAQRLATRERMVRMDRQRQPVVAVGAVLEAVPVDMVPGHADRRAALAQMAHQFVREAFLDVDLDVAVGRLAHERRDVVEQRLGDRRDRRDQSHATLDAAAERCDVARDAVHREQHGAGMLEQREPGRRRLDAAPRAQQERRAEIRLELRDALADRRRLDVLLLGRARHVAVVADGDEQTQRLQVDVAHAR